MWGHDNQSINPAAHRAERSCSLSAAAMQVREEEQIAAAARLAVHSAHDFGEEFAVEVGEHHANRVVARKAEAARAGVGDIAELRYGARDPLARMLADIVETVEGARHGRDGQLRTPGYVT